MGREISLHSISVNCFFRFVDDYSIEIAYRLLITAIRSYIGLNKTSSNITSMTSILHISDFEYNMVFLAELVQGMHSRHK